MKKRLIDANALNWGRCPANSWQAKAWLDEAPTVDAVEVVHGRWIKRIVDHEIPGYWIDECSICGFVGDVYLFQYCPNCGAKMDGGNEDEL